MNNQTIGTTPEEDKALDGISVAPPSPSEEPAGSVATTDHPTTDVREGHDADSHEGLKRDPTDADAKLDIGLDETFPGSDAPSTTRPGSSTEPAPSSGYDEAAERERAASH